MQHILRTPNAPDITVGIPNAGDFLVADAAGVWGPRAMAVGDLALVPLATGVSGTLPVANGGTSLTTLTAHALYVGNGASAPTALAVGGTGTVLTGVTGANPAWSNAPALTSLTVGTSVGSFGASLQTQQTSTEILTNSVTPGGTTGTVGNVVAANVDTSAAALVETRNAIYQLARKVAQLQAALVAYGLLAA